MGILDLDPRWRALMAKGGVIDIGFDHPSDWPHEARDDAPFVKFGEDQLASELCRFGEARYIRIALSLPIRGSDDSLNIAAWAEVSPAVFYAYIDHLEGADAPGETLCVLANDLTPIAAQDSALTLDFGDGNARPLGQIDGAADISLDGLIAVYEATGTLERGALKPS